MRRAWLSLPQSLGEEREAYHRGRPPGTKQGHLGFVSTPRIPHLRCHNTFLKAKQGGKGKKKKQNFFQLHKPCPILQHPGPDAGRRPRRRGSPSRSGRWGAPRPAPVPAAASWGPVRAGSAHRAVTQRTAPSGDVSGASVCNYPAKYRGKLLSERGSGSSSGRTRYAPGTHLSRTAPPHPAPPDAFPAGPAPTRTIKKYDILIKDKSLPSSFL